MPTTRLKPVRFAMDLQSLLLSRAPANAIVNATDLSRRAVVSEYTAVGSTVTPYGRLKQSWQLGTTTGETVVVEFIHPFALLHLMSTVEASKQFLDRYIVGEGRDVVTTSHQAHLWKTHRCSR